MEERKYTLNLHGWSSNKSDPKNFIYAIDHMGISVFGGSVESIIRVYEMVRQNKEDATIDDVTRIIEQA